jgi:carboxyl-terminal processing protease
MKVVKALMDEKNEHAKVEESNVEQGQGLEIKSGYIRLKKFHFIMLLFLVVFLSAGITTFALAFGDEKVVTVGTERPEFDKLYEAFDTLKSGYYKNIDQKKAINGAINGMVE